VSKIYDILSEDAQLSCALIIFQKIYAHMAKNSITSPRPYGVWDRMGTTTSLDAAFLVFILSDAAEQCLQ